MISNLPSVKAVGILGDKYVDGPRKRAKLWRRKDSLREERAVRVGEVCGTTVLYAWTARVVSCARASPERLCRAVGNVDGHAPPLDLRGFGRAILRGAPSCHMALAVPSQSSCANFGTHGNQERSAMVSRCARATLSRAPQAAPAWHAKPFSPSGLRFLQGLWRKKCGCLPRSRACTLVRLCFYGLCRLNRSSPTCEGAPAREVATCLHGTRWMWSAGESRRMRL